MEQQKQQDVTQYAKKQRYCYLLGKMKMGKALTPSEIAELEKLKGTPQGGKKTPQQAIATARRRFLLSVMNDKIADVSDRLRAAEMLGRIE